MNLLQRVRQDVLFVRDAARAYSILRRVRADAEVSVADLVEERIQPRPTGSQSCSRGASSPTPSSTRARTASRAGPARRASGAATWSAC